MDIDDPYETLGVTPETDPSVVDAAYKALVKEYHPDQGGTQEQFKRIKTAYERIKHEDQVGKQETKAATSPNSEVNVSCSKCGESFYVKTRYFNLYGEEPFCQDCRVHTQCNSCNKGLRLMPSRYRELGGDPVVCISCAKENTTDRSKSFWNGLSIGEKIVFPICLAILGFNILLMATGAESGFLTLSALLIAVWIYQRGKRNGREQ